MHMTIPIFSIITLITELFITASVFYIVWKGRTQGVFYKKLTYTVLSYEALFNITYMVHQAMERAPEHIPTSHGPYVTLFGIFHGIFSLLMFVALIVFMITAAKRYAGGENFFLVRSTLTNIFLGAWSISILSGVGFFVILYLL